MENSNFKLDIYIGWKKRCLQATIIHAIDVLHRPLDAGVFHRWPNRTVLTTMHLVMKLFLSFQCPILWEHHLTNLCTIQLFITWGSRQTFVTFNLTLQSPDIGIALDIAQSFTSSTVPSDFSSTSSQSPWIRIKLNNSCICAGAKRSECPCVCSLDVTTASFFVTLWDSCRFHTRKIVLQYSLSWHLVQSL